MIKAIFYKEWIKSRRIISLLLLIAVLLVVYTFTNNAHTLRVTGEVKFWSLIIERDAQIVPDFTKWFFVISALLISITQYASEMTNKRFKLTLHLPISESKIVWTMQLFGLATIAVLYLITFSSIWIGFQFYFPKEIIIATMMQLMPYALCGVTCYFFTAWIILEPIWRRRIAYITISLAGLSMFTIDGISGAYIYAVPTLIIIILASIACSFHSATRFKDGAQQ